MVLAKLTSTVPQSVPNKAPAASVRMVAPGKLSAVVTT